MARPRISIALAALCFAALACNKADRANTTPPTDPPASAPVSEHHADEPGEQHEHDFSTQVDAFHDTMAPLWHAEAGDTRIQNTCDAVPDLIARAQEIAAAEAPKNASDPAAWKAAAADLTEKVEALVSVCEQTPAEFDASFHAVHEAFHALVKLIGHEE